MINAMKFTRTASMARRHFSRDISMMRCLQAENLKKQVGQEQDIKADVHKALSAFEKEIDYKLDGFEKTMDLKFTVVDIKFAGVEKLMDIKFANMDTKFATVDEKFANVKDKLAGVNDRHDGLDKKLDKLFEPSLQRVDRT